MDSRFRGNDNGGLNMSAKEILRETESKMKKTMETVFREFSEVRTGRAQPALVEDMHINYYETSTPIKQLAAVSSPTRPSDPDPAMGPHCYQRY